MPITEDGVRTYSFTDPYYVAHQRLLVDEPSSIDGIDDLGTQGACSAINPTTGVALDAIDPTIHVTPAVPIDDCVALLRAGRVAAVTAPDVALIEVMFETPDVKIVGDDLTTEGYGAVVRTGASQFVDFVNAVWDEAKDEGRWMSFYDRWIAPHTNDPVEAPPIMTVEEAAALFPTGS
jgi:ABC-type amino acid transport substrate-binding protein